MKKPTVWITAGVHTRSGVGYAAGDLAPECGPWADWSEEAANYRCWALNRSDSWIPKGIRVEIVAKYGRGKGPTRPYNVKGGGA